MQNNRVDVLLAMSSPSLLTLTEKTLLREGLSVKTVSNGLDAVLIAFETKPRCIICTQLLAGMDGLKVSRFLHTMFSEQEMPVILSVPDRNSRVLKKANSSFVVDVIDYSASSTEIIDLLEKHMSQVRSSSVKVVSPVSRDRILQMVADSLEDSLESLEVIIHLVDELAGTTSISAACRKVVIAILNDLGFQRAWIGSLNKLETKFEAVAYKGKGITGDSLFLSKSTVYLPVDRIISDKKQIASWHFDFQDNRDTWAGCSNYVDTPVIVGNKVVGIIRCDNGLSRSKASDFTLKLLEMLAAQLSVTMKVFYTQQDLYNGNKAFSKVLSQIPSSVVFLNKQGIIESFFGDNLFNLSSDSGIANLDITKLLTSLSVKTVKLLSSAIKENKDIFISSEKIDDNLFVDISLFQNDSNVLLLAIDKTEKVLLRKKIELLEFETDAIASLATDLSSLMDVQEICRTMLRTIEAFYPEEAIAIFLAKEISSSITPDELIIFALSDQFFIDSVAQTGMSIELSDNESYDGVVKKVAQSGKLINISDTSQAQNYVKVISGINSELAIPMISMGRIIGVLDLQSLLLNRFGQDDIRKLNNIVGFASGILDTALQQTELILSARSDRLTGLNNMTFFEERYPEEFERAQRYEYSFSIIMMDIDDFKHYNDSFGHPMGNVFLQKITRAMKSAVRDVDLLVRYGGEEFVCILPLTNKQLAIDIAERIRKAVLSTSEIISNSDKQPMGCVSLSLGVSTYPEDSLEKDELLEIADQRMYRAKKAGKNRVCSN